MVIYTLKEFVTLGASTEDSQKHTLCLLVFLPEILHC